MLQFYLPHYLIYEVTNIPQGFYRFFSKLGLETSGLSIANAVVWILSFGAIRVVQGTYVTALVMQDLWAIYHMSLTKDELSAADWAAFQELSRNGIPPEPVSLATVLFWFVCGSILVCLNFMWFYLLIRTVIRKLPRKSQKDQQ
jgi:hypothetical protein